MLNSAVRCLYQEKSNMNPDDAKDMKNLEKFSYVDHIFMAGDTDEQTIQLARKAITILRNGKFELGKFRSFPPELSIALGHELTFEPYKILGCRYNP